MCACDVPVSNILDINNVEISMFVLCPVFMLDSMLLRLKQKSHDIVPFYISRPRGILTINE